MIEIIQEYWRNYLYSDGYRLTGVVITLWLLVVSIIGLADVVKAAQDAGKSTFNMFFFILIAALIYLAITTMSNCGRFSASVRLLTAIWML